ncbi:DUF881 domain-containing protein [Mycolicibacterium arenosum]|uniref:DUF881 domain-containing protein n=1 Tax=Mycolicibacterium arenosum TaxID=2952157 RepID=A0ABT1M7M0_9MYCO|nr:DUF881 domain-containing protein [Mycolicibacterium sp. CAU 1645]MCP9275176.1 DUF881 domain-containing protein [Mycolicibacterium sp. CAU 1645]
MSDDERALGGYSSEAGRNAHEADAPTLIPVPSLLRSLLSDHLDPGYAAARTRPQRGRLADWSWQLCAGLVVAAVFAAAVAQAQSVAPAAVETQHVLADGVRSAEQSTRDATGRRDALATEVEDERRTRLEGDAEGRGLLAGLDTAEFAAGATGVRGPGLAVVVTEPDTARDLSDVSKQRVEGSRQIILDRDLQLAVNSLWAAGAEAVSVGGVRIGPNVTIRQAGGGMLVDNQPIVSPYEILAVGPPKGMHDVFEHSPGLARLRLLETSYGVGVTVTESDGLTLPASTVRDVIFAKGPPQ